MDDPYGTPGRVIFVVDVVSLRRKGTPHTPLLAAARCLEACYVLNPDLRWGYLFYETGKPLTAIKGRVKALCQCSGELLIGTTEQLSFRTSGLLFRKIRLYYSCGVHLMCCRLISVDPGCPLMQMLFSGVPLDRFPNTLEMLDLLLRKAWQSLEGSCPGLAIDILQKCWLRYMRTMPKICCQLAKMVGNLLYPELQSKLLISRIDIRRMGFSTSFHEFGGDEYADSQPKKTLSLHDALDAIRHARKRFCTGVAHSFFECDSTTSSMCCNVCFPTASSVFQHLVPPSGNIDDFILVHCAGRQHKLPFQRPSVRLVQGSREKEGTKT